MPLAVFLTADGTRDLEELSDYIARNDAPDKAEKILNETEKAFSRLLEFPERGAYPKELLALGIREYREVFYKPYRLIYRIIGKVVYVLLIVDGRRDMQRLLQQRLLEF